LDTGSISPAEPWRYATRGYTNHCSQHKASNVPKFTKIFHVVTFTHVQTFAFKGRVTSYTTYRLPDLGVTQCVFMRFVALLRLARPQVKYKLGWVSIWVIRAITGRALFPKSLLFAHEMVQIIGLAQVGSRRRGLRASVLSRGDFRQSPARCTRMNRNRGDYCADLPGNRCA